MRKLFSLILPLLIIGLLVVAPQTRAQGGSSVPPGADIVFVVDQSGSMSNGSILNAKDPRCTSRNTTDCPRSAPTDPDHLAILALSQGLIPIFNRIVTQEAERKTTDMIPEEHNVGVILFGGDPDNPAASTQIAVPLTRVEIQRDAVGNISSNIDAKLPREPQNLGETAFSRAFDVACTMLNCESPVPTGRRRVVVLLTDGFPSRDTINYSFENPASYFENLRQHHASLFANSELWVLGLDQTDRFWSRNETYWAQIAPGRTRLIRTPSGIGSFFAEIASKAVGEPLKPPRACDGSTFKVAPYLATLTLILEYPDTNSKAEFILPNGDKLSRDTVTLAGYSRSNLAESYNIRNPVPGEWTCKIIGTSVTPQFRDIQGLFRVTDVEIGRFGGVPSACRSFNLSVAYHDKDGNAIAEMPEYPLNQKLKITIDGTPIERSLVPVDDTRTKWHVDSDLSPGSSGGSYPLEIAVSLADNSKVYTDTRQTITIDPRLPCMSIAAPQNDGVSEMHNRLSPVGVTLEVQLNQGGKPGTPKGVFREPLETIVHGRLDGPEGLTRDVSLSPVEDKPGLFRAVVDDLPTTLAAGGTYTFTASLNATTQLGDHYELAPEHVVFTRQPGKMWQAVQIAIRVGVLIALALFLALIGFFIYVVTPPYPRGTLVFQRKVTGDAAEFRTWEEVDRFSLGRARLLGFLRTRWVMMRVRPSIQIALNLRRVRVWHHASSRQQGVKVVLYRAKKGGGTITATFNKHGDRQDLGNNHQVVYEDLTTKPKP